MKMTSNTVLITGGASGIGFELARQLLLLGNTVIVTGRDEARLGRAKQQLPALHTFQSDVGDPRAIDALFDEVTRKFPTLNVLVNNAGLMRKINLQNGEHDLRDLTLEVETNLIGPIRMVQRFLPQLKSQPLAAVVNVSSGLAFVPLPISPVYCAAKAGLHSFTRSLRKQLLRTNVRVFELAAPLTATTLVDAFDPEDMKGSTAMKVDVMVGHAIDAMLHDRFEIRPGQSNLLKIMSRIAPEFILGQLSKPVDRMLAQHASRRAT
jgi:uncharacterized oxidoreductase